MRDGLGSEPGKPYLKHPHRPSRLLAMGLGNEVKTNCPSQPTAFGGILIRSTQCAIRVNGGCLWLAVFSMQPTCTICADVRDLHTCCCSTNNRFLSYNSSPPTFILNSMDPWPIGYWRSGNLVCYGTRKFVVLFSMTNSSLQCCAHAQWRKGRGQPKAWQMMSDWYKTWVGQQARGRLSVDVWHAKATGLGLPTRHFTNCGSLC